MTTKIQHYRFWDITYKTYRSKLGLQHIFIDPWGNAHNFHDGSLGPSEIKIERFTGLTDRFGKQVFEGDILLTNLTQEEAALGNGADIGQVVFYAGTFSIAGWGPMCEHVLSESPNVLDQWEVIGNVNENAEFLD